MDINNINKEQEEHFSKNGKYKQTEKLKDNDSDVWIDEYVGPFGSGYLLNEEKIIGGEVYRKFTDFGPEGRSKDWHVIHGINR